MNSNNLRIVFMGTPDFAVGILDTLIQNKYNVVAVITSVDKPAGRGKKIRKSAVKEYAEKHKLPLLQPKNLKDESFLEKLKSYKADIQIIVAFRMLPKVVWAMPTYGTVNLHASLLPAYRGAAPINWAIINGESKTGVTTFFIDDKIDTGEILLQEEIAIAEDETAGTLHDKLMLLGSNLICKTIDIIQSKDYKTKKQPKMAPSLAPKIYKTTCKINWTDSLQNIYNKIRGLSPYPVAFSLIILNGKEYSIKIYKTHTSFERHNQKIGTIIVGKKYLKVAVIDGFLFLDEVQLAGKKRMDIVSFLNGYHILDDAKMQV